MLRIYFLRHWFNLAGPAVESLHLQEKGARITTGTIVDATIIQ